VGNVYLEDIGGAQAQMLGSRLKEQYGADYYVIGTEFYGGRFLAWDICGGYYSAFVSHQAVLPGEEAYAHHLHQADIPLYYLDLSGVDYATVETNWLMGPMNIRFIGASYCADFDAEFYFSTSLPVQYDGMVFFEDTHPVTRITF